MIKLEKQKCKICGTVYTGPLFDVKGKLGIAAKILEPFLNIWNLPICYTCRLLPAVSLAKALSKWYKK